jgi:hypothetical protein
MHQTQPTTLPLGLASSTLHELTLPLSSVASCPWDQLPSLRSLVVLGDAHTERLTAPTQLRHLAIISQEDSSVGELLLWDMPVLQVVRLLTPVACEVRRIDAARCPLLSEVRMQHGGVQQLAVADCPQLHHINVAGCHRLSSLPMGGIAATIVHLWCRAATGLGPRLQLSGLLRLQHLDVSGCDLEELVLEQCPNLVQLDCSHNKLTTAGTWLAGCERLETLLIDQNNLTDLQHLLHALPALCCLMCQHNPLHDAHFSVSCVRF